MQLPLWNQVESLNQGGIFRALSSIYSHGFSLCAPETSQISQLKSLALALNPLRSLS